MKRVLRRRLAVVFAFAIAFAQIAVAAQPWPLDVAPHRQHVPAAATTELPEHCAGHLTDGTSAPAPQAPSPNHCEVHCQDATQPHAAVAIPAPVADAWLAISLVLENRDLTAPDDALTAKCTSPPARVLYARFLN